MVETKQRDVQVLPIGAVSRMSDSAPYEDWSRRLGLTRFLKITRAITLVQAGKNTPPLKKGREARGERRKHFLQQVENLRSSALVGGCAIPFGIASLHASGNSALAQSNIVPDATLGAESSVVLNLNDLAVELIEGGAQRGQNLFHSFEEFNVSEGRGAFFFSPDEAIQNILVRVTGGNRSEILGRLVTFGNSEPNLFLINPNGITFGGNAGFFGGSFVASTANSVVFDNGFEFSTTNSQVPPLLSVNVPLGLQFGANPGSIVTQSAASLFVQPGSTLALVGSEVVLDGGRLLAPDGRVELGSVAANSRVNLIATNTGYGLGYESTEDFQDIRLLRNAFVYAGGEEGGSIQVQGRNVTLTDGSFIRLRIQGAGVGAGLSVNASESVQVIGRSADGQLASSLFASSDADSTGDLGNLTINTSRLLISDGASVSVYNFGSGDASNLTVNASEGVQVIGSGTSADGQLSSNLWTLTTETSNTGNLTITTPALLIRDGALVGVQNAGSGEGGSLTVNASESVQVIGRSADGELGSGLFAGSDLDSTGDVGNLTINTSRLLISDGASVNADSFSTGDGSNLTVNASESVQVIGTSADGQFLSRLSAQVGETSDGGNLTITTPALVIRDGAVVSVATIGSGKGGNLTVNASESVQVIGTSRLNGFASNLFADTFSTGEAGSLTIITPRLFILNGARVSAGTFGAGEGGDLIINASEEVQVIGTSTDSRVRSQLSTDTFSTGEAGNLTITTPRLLISDGARVTANTFGAGKAGNLMVNASQEVQVSGESADGQFPSNLLAQANENTTGDAGNLTIITGRLLILDGGQVSTATFGAGKGGLLTVNASQDVQVSGESTDARFSSALSVQTEGTGDAGNLNVTTPVLLVRDGAQVSAGTRSTGRGGNLIVNASQEVQLIGISADGQSSSGLFSSTLFGATAGNLTITTRQMSVRDGARVTVSSPQGQAGSLSITADSLTLNRGTISAETAKSDAQGGANINLSSLELLRLDNESLISATALEDANGGNITIDSTLIVATPPTASEGSDITANAIQGNGGSVTITTQGLFGIEFRENRTPQNDITVSSEFGISGVFEQNTPGIDPSRGLAELPTDVVNAAAMIDRHCNPGEAAQRSTFVVTGRGGLPPNPNDTLQGEAVVTNWVTLDPQEENINSPNLDANPTNTAPKQLVEAQGWVYGPDGQVILVAQAPTPTPESPWQTAPSCGDLDWR